MPLDHTLVGVTTPERRVTWSSTDTLLYAVGVGAGQGDPGSDLVFATENSDGVVQQVLPTWATVVAGRTGFPAMDGVDPTSVLHAEQSFTLPRQLAPDGEALGSATVVGVHEARGNAYVVVRSRLADARTGEELVTSTSTLFVRGAGGFGGTPPPSSGEATPERPAEEVVELVTRPEQALLYRLSGDRNPLHSDPTFAQRAGFDRPILHGLCTYGFTGRALLAAACGGDSARLVAMSARFSATVTPGSTLRVHLWSDEDPRVVRFRTTRADGTVVLDRGVLTRRAA